MLPGRYISWGVVSPCSIDARRNEVLARRQKLKDLAGERKDALKDSQAFQEFKRDAAEVRIYLHIFTGTYSFCAFI